MKEIITRNFFSNIQRVRDLTQIHLQIEANPTQYSLVYAADVLRAAVMLLHATLEDLLRGLYRWKLPDRGAEQWSKIPLKGLANGNHPKPFHFGNLKDYSEITVKDLLNQSLDEYLNYTNYNRIEDITTLLSEIEIDKEAIETYFPDLMQMMLRRHNIVHRADRERGQSESVSGILEINYSVVIGWLETVEKVGEKILLQV